MTALACQLRGHRDWAGWPHSPLDGTPEKLIQRVLKINASTKSLAERLCDLKICALSVFGYTGSIFAPDKATPKAEAHALNVRSQFVSIKDRRNGVGKPMFKLAPFGNAQLFDLATPDLRVPGIPDDALQQIISQASHLAQSRTANV